MGTATAALALTLLLLCGAAAFFALFMLRIMEIVLVRVPFVPLPKEALREVKQALRLDGASVVYDLGSGDGSVLLYLHRHVPEASYVGIEKTPYAFLLSVLRRRISGQRAVRFVLGSFFRTNLSSASHVFTYLYPFMMDELLPKLTRELKPGTRLISCDFPFSDKKPAEIIELDPARKRARRLYVYEF